MVGYRSRVTVESFVNVLQALLWPLLVLERFGGAGLAYLGIGFLVFERWLRPFIERAFPDLRPDRGARPSRSISDDRRGSVARSFPLRRPLHEAFEAALQRMDPSR